MTTIPLPNAEPDGKGVRLDGPDGNIGHVEISPSIRPGLVCLLMPPPLRGNQRRYLIPPAAASALGAALLQGSRATLSGLAEEFRVWETFAEGQHGDRACWTVSIPGVQVDLFLVVYAADLDAAGSGQWVLTDSSAWAFGQALQRVAISTLPSVDARMEQ